MLDKPKFVVKIYNNIKWSN